MFEHGYIVLPGVVPQAMVREARKAINHSLGEEGMNKVDMTRARSQTYCREVTNTPPITDLWNRTPAMQYAESLLGAGRVPTQGSGQIALRFPSLADPPGPPRPHVDGMYSPHNGVPEGRIMHFTMLGAVMLSDVTEENCGNFTVWPGTHRLFEDYFRKHTPQSLLKGMPDVAMPAPLQIRANAGDVVLTHYQLAHSVAPHVGPDIRYAIFFRITAVDHAKHDWNVMTDIWLEWEGMREIVKSPQTAGV